MAGIGPHPGMYNNPHLQYQNQNQFQTQRPTFQQQYQPPSSTTPNQIQRPTTPNPQMQMGDHANVQNQMQNLNLNNTSRNTSQEGQSQQLQQNEPVKQEQRSQFQHIPPSNVSQGFNQSGNMPQAHRMQQPNVGLQQNSPNMRQMNPPGMQQPGMRPQMQMRPPNFGGMQPPPGQGMQPPPGQSMQPPPGQGMQPPPGQGMQPPPGQGMQLPPGQRMQLPPGQTMQPQYGQGMQPPPGQGMQPPPGMQQPRPNMPPGPNQPQQYNNLPPGPNMGGHRPPMQQRRQQKGLDPDSIPHPIEVIKKDKNVNGAKPFQTQMIGELPPLHTTLMSTRHIPQDQGSAIPNYVRATTYQIPFSDEYAKGSKMPITFNTQPFFKDDEYPPLFIADHGEGGPIRCKRCKAYVAPSFKFSDGGRTMTCRYCHCSNNVPEWYMQHLDHQGNRVDKYTRPELCRGSYEYKANKSYCINGVLPSEPGYVFCIDVTLNAVKSGMVRAACEGIKNFLSNLPKIRDQPTSNIRVGIICYTKVLHFFNINEKLAQPKHMIVSDVDDIFVPLQDGFLTDPNKNATLIQTLLEQIPVMFSQNNLHNETVYAPVIQAGFEALKSNNASGKLFIFHSSGLPTAEAPGKLKSHEDKKLLGTNKEHLLWTPAEKLYTQLAKDCVYAGVTVDQFLFTSQHSDIATLSEVSNLTSGQVYKYSFYNEQRDQEQFLSDLKYSISSMEGFDATMRIRTSLGIRHTGTFGNYFMDNTTDVHLAGVSKDCSLSFELKHDDKLENDQNAEVQIAILYTTVNGERRIRIHNLSLAISKNYNDIFSKSNNNVLLAHLIRSAIFDGKSKQTMDIKDSLVDRTVAILAAYRRHCSASSSAGQLILPETLKLLPLCLHSLLKHDVLNQESSIPCDQRAYLRAIIANKPLFALQILLYPAIHTLSDMAPLEKSLGDQVRCRYDRLSSKEVYLITNGLNLFLWVGSETSEEWVNNIFQLQHVNQISVENCRIHYDSENTDITHLTESINLIRATYTFGHYMKLSIVRQGDNTMEHWFRSTFLVEDKGLGQNSKSYSDFLCSIHNRIRELLDD